MSVPPGLTRHERAAVEKVLRAAGWCPSSEEPDFYPHGGSPDVWVCWRGTALVELDLREVFPTSFTVQEVAIDLVNGVVATCSCIEGNDAALVTTAVVDCPVHAQRRCACEDGPHLVTPFNYGRPHCGACRRPL